MECVQTGLFLVFNIVYALLYLREIKDNGYKNRVKIMLAFLILAPLPKFAIRVWQISNNTYFNMYTDEDQKNFFQMIQIAIAMFYLVINVIYLIFGFYVMNLEVVLDQQMSSVQVILKKILKL